MINFNVEQGIDIKGRPSFFVFIKDNTKLKCNNQKTEVVTTLCYKFCKHFLKNDSQNCTKFQLPKPECAYENKEKLLEL